MYFISAADAIMPAVRRTRDFLFRPFRLGAFLKLSLVAVLTEGLNGGNNFHANRPTGHSSGNLHAFSPPANLAKWIPVIVAAALVIVVLGLVISYLITRLRFAYFHCLVHNTQQIAPGWRLYRSQATRFFWLNVFVGFCFLLFVAIVALSFGPGLWRAFQDIQAGGQPDFGQILSLILPLIPIILLLALAGFTSDLILRDLMLPHFALDNASAGEAWSEVWANIMAEKGAFFVYALLRILLPIAAAFALFIAMIVPAILFVAVTAGIEVAIHAAFANPDGATAIGGIVLLVIVGIIAFGVAVLAGLCIGGPLSTAVREYALLFYGGRYQPLGDLLFPPLPPAAGPIAPGTA